MPVGAEDAGARPMSGSRGGGLGRRIRLGNPTSRTAQPIAPIASLATFGQRIRGRLPIAPYNPSGRGGAPGRGPPDRYSRSPFCLTLRVNTSWY
jgi:hypothetical protein